MRRATSRFLPIIGLIALVAAAQALHAPAEAEGPNRVGLVVRFADSSVFTDCIEFSESAITGEDVLDRSGLSLVKDLSYGLGAAICKIEDVGCDDSAPCFCQCTGEPPCEYWAYYHLDQETNQWVYSGMGASWHTVEPGDVEGWSWGAGDAGGSDVEPPLFAFEDLCAPPTATPTNTPQPSPPEVDFAAEPGTIVAGQCSTLQWTVENAEVAVLEGEGVKLDDSRYVCPTRSETYELRVLNAAGEFQYEVTINVIEPTPTPTPPATATPRPAATPTRRPSSAPAPPAPTRSVEPSPTSPPATSAAAETVTASPTPAVVAMLPEPTAPPVAGNVSEPPKGPQADELTTNPAEHETASQEGVGLSRIMLLLGVSVGTIGFGGLVFFAILVLLIVVYLRAREQFAQEQESDR